MTDTYLEAEIRAERDSEAQAIARAEALEASLTQPAARHDLRDNDTGRFRPATDAETHGAVISALLHRVKPNHARVMAALRRRAHDPLAGRVEEAPTFPDTGAGYQPQPRYRRTPEQGLREHGDVLMRLRDQKGAARSPFVQF